MTKLSVQTRSRLAAYALLAGLALGTATDAAAQCQLVAGPSAFDPPASGLPSYLRSSANSLGISASARRLVVRYNYGYVVYSLAAPAAPSVTSVEDLMGADGYPKSGDGQSRTGPVALSSDGLRALISWTDDPGFGTITQPFNGSSFVPGGDFLPEGYNAVASTAVHLGTRYLGFTAANQGLYVANVTTLPTSGSSSKNSIPSEAVAGIPRELTGVTSVESGSKAFVITWTQTHVYVVDVSEAGTTIPGLSTTFVTRDFLASSLGVTGSGATVASVSAAAHPTDGAIHLLVEGTRYSGGQFLSTGVRLFRLDPSAWQTAAPTEVGSYSPPTGEWPQPESVLLPFDTDLVAFSMHRLGTAGGLKLHARSSLDFSTELAGSIANIATPATANALKGFRSSGGNAHLYVGDSLKTYALSLNCATAPGPATAQLAVERVPLTGAATSVPDGGSVFIGDQVRIKPAYAPPDSVSPLLDWRLDYDFHDGNAADSQAAAMRLIKADASRTLGPSLPPAELTLIGPCDPAQVPDGGSAPNPATGAGCWTSVTTNGAYGIPAGTADFATIADKQLRIAFEVQNALNAGGSSVAQHRITWKVPQQLLKSGSILSGGALEDASEGSPATTGYKWYFAQVPGTETGYDQLTLEASCTGPTCSPTFTQAGQTISGLQRPGTYRYWVVTPYRGGYTTPECPGLSGTTCTGSSAKTVTVTDVVLSFTMPSTVLVGQTNVALTSSSKKATSVGPCPSTSTGFTYNVCEVLTGACAEGGYVSSGLLASSPFTGGSVTIPTPGIGTWGIRVKYSYSTGGSCVSPSESKWPADGSWAPLTVLQAVPSIQLTNASTGATLPKSLGIQWEGTANVAMRAYALLDGVRDANPPSGLNWSYRLKGSQTETQIGTTQGATFTISTPETYEVVLRGYGAEAVVEDLGISPPSGGGGGSGSTLTITSVSVSTSSPTTGQSVTFSCNTSGGSGTLSYDWVLDTGVTRSTTSKTTSYSYSTSGTKTYSCAVSDGGGSTAGPRVGQLTVQAGGGGGTGSCAMDIKDAQGARISYDPSLKLYETTAGKPLTFVATGTTGTVSWDFGNGVFGSGATYVYSYPAVTSTQTYTVRMTSSSCGSALTTTIAISPGAASLDYTVADASTGAAIEKSGTTWVATAGQRLKFTAQNVTGDVWWDFGDGTNSTVASPEKTYAPVVDTTYTASLSNNGLTKSYSISVKGSTGAPLTGAYTFRYADGTTVNRAAVTPNKPITFTAADQATTYTWDFGDGSALAQGSPKEHTYTRGGTFAVKLTVARTGVAGTVTTPSPLTFVVTPPPDPLLWVAGGMAYADGSGGERWQSDLSIHNPGSSSASVSLAFVPGASWEGASNVSWTPLVVGPGETRAFANVLGGFFAASKGSWGVVLVRGDNVAVSPIIVSRTYNAASADVAGTFGLSVPAMSVANGVKPQSAAGGNFLAGLRHDAAFRTNLTVANLKDEAAVIEVVFRDASGNALGAPAKVTVEGRGVKQLNGALSAPVAGASDAIGGAGWSEPVSQFSAEVKIKSGSGVYPYATVIDQGTGDSIVVTPTARPSTTYRLPGIVRVQGGGGTYWVSDIALLNPTASARKVRVAYSYVKTGTTRRIEVSDVVPLAPYQLASAVDFVKSWLGLAAEDPDGYASSFVDFSPAPDDPAPTSPLVVSGKTYTPSGRGTIGLQLDPFILEDGINETGSRKKLVLSGLEASTKFRTNVALFLTPGSTGSTQVDVRVLDSFGREAKKIANIGLDVGNPFVQLNSGDLFGSFNTDDASRATIVVENPRGTAYLAAYATVIDQKSGDATFVAGQPAP